MDKRCLVVLGVCLVMGLAFSSMAMAETVASGNVLYWDGHYLAGTAIPLGYDMFGINYQDRVSNGSAINWALAASGYPPYQGDDVAYYQRLREEGYIRKNWSDEKVEDYLNATLWYWWGRGIMLDLQWNEAYLSKKDSDGDGFLDWHRFTDPPHDMDGDFTGSGAAVEAHWGALPGHTYSVWAAAPEDAYLMWTEKYGDPSCLCPTYYLDVRGIPVEIGYAGAGNDMLPGSTDCWLTVYQECYCEGVLLWTPYQAPYDWGDLHITD